MLYDDYVKALVARTHRMAEVTTYGVVTEAGQRFPLLRLRNPGAGSVVVVAGFHGEEPAGPLTFLEHGPDLLAYARDRGVGLQIYPCVNPSGFEDGSRYNRSGEQPNNAFLEYEVSPGVWAGELAPGTTSFRRLREAPSKMPQETRALYQDLCRIEGTPGALLDLHQDDEIQEEAFYAYTFGDKAVYLPLVHASERLARPLQNVCVDDTDGFPVSTDGAGLIEYHDGGVQDWGWRRGTPYTATLETTTATPMVKALALNALWVRGFIDLVAREVVAVADAVGAAA